MVEGLTASANVTDARTVRRPVVLTIAVAVLGSTTAAAALPRYEGSVSRLDDELRAEMTGSSWRSGCPVPLRELRLVRITYVGFDAEAHRGRLVVHRRWASEMLEVFGRIYSRGFPIRRVRLVDRYEADDQASMRADNTSAFNCRYVAGTTTWSRHAYGAAIDVNPVENPYVLGGRVSPPAGRRYLDRGRVRPGMAVEGGVLVDAFESVGWEWGGRWSSSRDYQHFSTNGR